jgi:hypothetical protein
VNPRGQRPATAGPGTVHVPPHPVPALTTYELRDYRKQLEHALGDHVIGRAPIAARLRETLAEVLAEEQSRVRLQQANGASR